VDKKKVARKAAPKDRLVDLTRVKILRVEEFSGKPIPRKHQHEMSVDEAALALDFFSRLSWRRIEKEKEAWIDAEKVADRLHTLRRLMQATQALMAAEEIGPVEDYELADLMSDVFEYLAVRAELAGETHIPRERRYMLSVDWRAVAPASPRKAVA
jgi:hypothetical protein